MPPQRNTLNHKNNIMLKRAIIAIGAFVFSSILSGQILMHGQGESIFQEIKYGLLYVASGCGIPQVLGDNSTAFIYALIFQIVVTVVAVWAYVVWQSKMKQVI